MSKRKSLGSRPIDPKDIPKDEEVKKLFNHLWIKSIGTSQYDREEWKKMEDMLRKKGIEL